jgi:LmbE family N-acetylglucosaminyl deacetylase
MSFTGSHHLYNLLLKASRALVIAPHPDDETIGCALLMQRRAARGRSVHVACLTNGIAEREAMTPGVYAPYGNYERYCKARLTERRQVMAGLQYSELYFRNKPTRGLLRDMDSAYGELLSRAKRLNPSILLCPAYEGGHPDHDIANCLTHGLGAALRLPCIEYALYHRYRGAAQYQRFLPGHLTHITKLSGAAREVACKAAWLRLYGSQHNILKSFSPRVELYRRMPRYDYARPPTTETTYYEIWNSGVSHLEVCRACIRFLEGR